MNILKEALQILLGLISFIFIFVLVIGPGLLGPLIALFFLPYGTPMLILIVIAFGIPILLYWVLGEMLGLFSSKGDFFNTDDFDSESD